MGAAEAIELVAKASGSVWSRRCRGVFVLTLAPLLLGLVTGCGPADPNDAALGEQQEAICRRPCRPGPTTLVSGVAPSSIALSDTNAFFSNAFSLVNELDQIPLVGGAKTVLATSTTAMTSVVRFGGELFWADVASSNADGGVWEVSTAGGAPTQLSHRANDLVSGQAVAVYASGSKFITRTTHVLFGDPLVAKLYDTRLSLSGISEVSLLPSVDPVTMLNYYPFSLVLDSTHVYFTHDSGGGVFRAPLSGGAATQLVGGVARTALAIDGSTLFFQQGTDIEQMSVAGGAVSTLAPGVGTVSAMVAHSGVLYWACGSCGTVVKQTIGTSTSTVLASGQDNPHSLAVDDFNVYFGTNSALKRIAR